jgi:adenine/guanine phosphoribosyltransferase-like PRPP-binding protein
MRAPHEFWQNLEPPGSFATDGPCVDFFPATLPDGHQLLLPLRVLPGDGKRGVAGLICNQASFEVFDALAQALFELVAPFKPDVIVGVPTLGLSLADRIARLLGHHRMVALGTSPKFWYREELSELLASVTTPERRKRLYVDHRLLPLLLDRRVVVVDDVISSGQSMTAALSLMRKVDVLPVAAAVVMEQGQRWRDALAVVDPNWPDLVRGVFRSPLLRPEGPGWIAVS